jgi:hypothetical protein
LVETHPIMMKKNIQMDSQSSRKQRNPPTLPSTPTNLRSHPCFPIEPTILLPTKHTSNNISALLLRLKHSPLRQQLPHTFPLELRIHTTDMQIPTLRAIARPVPF